MKKTLRAVISVFLVFAIAIAGISPITDVYAATKTVKVTGKYYQSDARKMKKMINAFRTGDEAWYYKEEGSDKKVKLKDLKKLSYDYELEKIAMRRAAEISILFEHVRPNGEMCFSLFPDGYYTCGENIAMGTSSIMSTSEVLELWKETKESYNGQGHRRNMLNEEFTAVGVACFEANGNKYWVQEFGSPNSGKSKTKACNSEKTVKI
nr:CAP domain-containing protein [Lachnospiraceae bacterium]